MYTWLIVLWIILALIALLLLAIIANFLSKLVQQGQCHDRRERRVTRVQVLEPCHGVNERDIVEYVGRPCHV